MAGIYVDTSALGRVLLGEPDAGLIRETLARHDPWWSSALVLVELRRLARREGVEQDAEELLSLVSTQRLDLPALSGPPAWTRSTSARSTPYTSTLRFSSRSGTRSMPCSPSTISFRPAARTTGSRSKHRLRHESRHRRWKPGGSLRCLQLVIARARRASKSP